MIDDTSWEEFAKNNLGVDGDAFYEAEIEQGTDEWLRWRKNKQTASDACVVMNCAPAYRKIKTPADLRESKHPDYAEPPVSDFTQRMFDMGHLRETQVRDYIGSEGMGYYIPICLESVRFNAGDAGDMGLAASYDGVINCVGDDFYDQPIWLEVKTTGYGERSSIWKHIKANLNNPIARERVPPHIWWQLVHQAVVLQPQSGCMSLVVYLDGGLLGSFGNIHECEVGFNPEDIHLFAIDTDDLMADAPILANAWFDYSSG